MSTLLAPLIRLQSLDSRSAEIKKQQRNIPALLEAARHPLHEATRRLTEVTAAAEKSAKTRRDREQDLDSQEAQIGKLKSRASEIKKNAEYQAHLFEIQLANKKKGDIEEQILLLMEEVDRSQQEVAVAKARGAEAEGVFHQHEAALQALDARLNEELSGLGPQQQEVTATIEKSLLDRYTKLKATRKEVAVVRVQDGICTGCRLQLAPQLITEVKRSQEVLTCSFCHRILYWEAEAGQGADVAVGAGSTAADGGEENG